LEKIITGIRDDIIKIIQGGHITSYELQEMNQNGVWDKILGAIRKLGKVGNIIANILDHYKDQLVGMIKKVTSTVSSGLVKIISDIRDDIIKIIGGGHVTPNDLEEMSNNLEDVWGKILGALRKLGKAGNIIANILDHYKDQLGGMIKKATSTVSGGLEKIITGIRDDIIKIIQGGHITAYELQEMSQYGIWETITGLLRKSGTVGSIIANILDMYKGTLTKIETEVKTTILGGLIKVIKDLRDDIIRIIKTGHITSNDVQELSNNFDDVWGKILGALRKAGKVGNIVANILDHYKDQLGGMIKKVTSTVSGGLVKIITDIKDDIIKIIQGGHITSYELQEMSQNGVWDKILGAIRKLGKVGNIIANILDHYKDQLVGMIKKVTSTVSSGLVKIITDIRDDIIKIIGGGHVTPNDLQEMAYGFKETWDKIMTALRNSGRFGEILAKIIDHYKDEVIMIVEKIGRKMMGGIEKIIVDIRDDVIKIMQGGKVTGIAYIEDEDYSFASIWDKVTEAARSIGGKIGTTTRAILDRYKDQITKSLAKIKKVAIDDSMKIIIDIKNDIIRIIEGGHVVATSSPVTVTL